MTGTILRAWIKALTLLLVTFSLFPAAANADFCSATFPSGLQTFSPNGTIKFEQDAQLLGDPDGIIETFDIDKKQQSTLAT